MEYPEEDPPEEYDIRFLGFVTDEAARRFASRGAEGEEHMAETGAGERAAPERPETTRIPGRGQQKVEGEAPSETSARESGGNGGLPSDPPPTQDRPRRWWPWLLSHALVGLIVWIVCGQSCNGDSTREITVGKSTTVVCESPIGFDFDSATVTAMQAQPKLRSGEIDLDVQTSTVVKCIKPEYVTVWCAKRIDGPQRRDLTSGQEETVGVGTHPSLNDWARSETVTIACEADDLSCNTDNLKDRCEDTRVRFREVCGMWYKCRPKRAGDPVRAGDRDTAASRDADLGGEEEKGTERCRDSKDNDGDGQTDCDDLDCKDEEHCKTCASGDAGDKHQCCKAHAEAVKFGIEAAAGNLETDDSNRQYLIVYQACLAAPAKYTWKESER